MALRVKCKCGKALKISSKFADKKISCPGCKRPFRIPAAKFKAAAARAKKKAGERAAQKPAAAAPIPAPLDLDIQPANLDMELSGEVQHSQSDILSDILESAPPPVEASQLCPSCRGPITPDAVMWVNCGYNMQTGGSAGGPAAPSMATPAGTMGYASDPRKKGLTSAISDDAIQGAKNSFWTNAFSSFIYPVMSTGNLLNLIGMMFVSCLILVVSAAMGFGLCYVFIGCLILFIILMGWMCAFYLSVVQETAAGISDLPGFKMEDGLWDDAFKPAFTFIGAIASVFLPSIGLLFLSAWGLLPSSMDFLITVWWFAGLFLLPMSVLLFALGVPGVIFRIDLIIVTIFRTFLPYLAIWLMLFLVGMLYLIAASASILGTIGISEYLPDIPNLGWFSPFIIQIVNVYLMVVAMRIIGLYYLHFKNRFAIVME